LEFQISDPFDDISLNKDSLTNSFSSRPQSKYQRPKCYVVGSFIPTVSRPCSSGLVCMFVTRLRFIEVETNILENANFML